MACIVLAKTIFAQQFDTQLKIMSKAFSGCCYNDVASFPSLPTPAFVAFNTKLAVPWNEANHDPFLELVLWHSSLLTLHVKVFAKQNQVVNML